jgi:hypothetical protein
MCVLPGIFSHGGYPIEQLKKVNTDDKINGGAFLVARKLFDSELWLEKPSSWKVIWIYIFGKVNHKVKGKFQRGEGYFNFSQEIKSIGIDITPDKIKSFCQWARATSMIDTRRTTRGMIIKVNKYGSYQCLDNYSNTNKTTSKPRENHERTTMINKNDKNVKNEKNIYIPVRDIVELYNSTCQTLPKVSLKLPLSDLRKKAVVSRWHKFAKLKDKQGIEYGIRAFEELFTLAQLVNSHQLILKMFKEKLC